MASTCWSPDSSMLPCGAQRRPSWLGAAFSRVSAANADPAQGTGHLVLVIATVTRPAHRLGRWRAWPGRCPPPMPQSSTKPRRVLRVIRRECRTDIALGEPNGGSATRSTPACAPTPARLSQRPAQRTREGNRGTTLSPARPTSTPNTGSSDQPLPGQNPAYDSPPPSDGQQHRPGNLAKPLDKHKEDSLWGGCSVLRMAVCPDLVIMRRAPGLGAAPGFTW